MCVTRVWQGWRDILGALSPDTHCCRCSSPASTVANFRAVKELHRETAAKLGVDAATCEEVEGLLTQLQQLLVGISIMQVGGRVRAAG